MQILRLDDAQLAPIPFEPYRSVAAASAEIACGDGEAHLHLVRVQPGGEIGPHQAGFGQLWFAAAGHGWVAGPDGVRHPLAQGQAALIVRGEVHAKGSDTGMTALMVQVRELTDAPGGTPVDT